VKPIICHIITTFHEKAASTRRTLNVCTALLLQGYTVYIVVGKDASFKLMDSCKEKGLKIIQINSLVKNIQPFKDFNALLALIISLRRMKCDIIHTHLSKDGVLGRLAAKMSKVKIICHTVHGPTAIHEELNFVKRAVYIFIERFLANFTTVMIIVGKEIKEKYFKLGIGNTDKYRVIHTGRDLSKYLSAKQMSIEEKNSLRKKLGIEVDDVVIGYIARIAPFKGYEYAIRACKKLSKKHNKIKFLFIGDANIPSRIAYEMMIKKSVLEFGLEDFIIFLDHKYNIERYYSIFDIFICPSLSEGLPNVILEAAIMELPIVAFDCGGVKEILGENECIVKTKDIEKFTERIEQLILSHKKRKQLVANRKYTVTKLMSMWSLETMIKNKCNLYKELLEKVHKG
jgi:glycosyltransferase involved in cell wall biosynthesis